MHAYNPVSFDLGLPMKAMANLTQIDDYVRRLDKRFDLVLLVEYFDESLIIMRDMLGWTNYDILSFAVNFRKDSGAGKPQIYKGVDLNSSVEDRAMVYSALQADTKLYMHFKRKLESIIKENKLYIEKEKRHLLETRRKWMNYCVAKSVPSGQIKDHRFRTYGNAAYGYVLTEQGLKNQTCVDLAMAELPFVARVHKYQPPAR